jgi:hypothetical protein
MHEKIHNQNADEVSDTISTQNNNENMYILRSIFYNIAPRLCPFWGVSSDTNYIRPYNLLHTIRFDSYVVIIRC